MPKGKQTTGRPSVFSKELAAQICALMSEGKSLRKICESDEFPSKTTIFRWLADNEVFRDQYARAREAQTDCMAEEILDIADDGTNDYGFKEGDTADGKSAVPVFLNEHVQRSKLRVDARKWLMAKMAPKKYGDFQRTELTGKDGTPLNQTLPDDKLESKLADLLRKAGVTPAPGGEGPAQADA